MLVKKENTDILFEKDIFDQVKIETGLLLKWFFETEKVIRDLEKQGHTLENVSDEMCTLQKDVLFILVQVKLLNLSPFVLKMEVGSNQWSWLN